MSRILITGASGMLGSNLLWRWRGRHELFGAHLHHPVSLPPAQSLDCDLLDPFAVRRVIDEVRPDWVVHAAALTSIDECERHPLLAFEHNVTATDNLVEAMRGCAARLVYISTDAVYADLPRPKREDDPASPIHHYGLTKFAGEQRALRRAGTVVLRTNILGWPVHGRRQLASWALGELRAGRPLRGLTDVLFNPLFTFDLADVIESLAGGGASGVFNVASRGAMSKYDFLVMLAKAFGHDADMVRPATRVDLDLAAQRPGNLLLDVSRVESLAGPMPTIEQTVERFLAFGCSRDADALRSMRVGEDVGPTISYGRQHIDRADGSAVVTALYSPYLTQGPGIARFEQALAQRQQAGHVVAVNSGTAALHLACRAAGLGEGDELITAPITFVASANCGLYCGATPVFADVDPVTANMDPASLAQRLTPRTKVVIPVHFAGQSCDMLAIRSIVDQAARRFGHRIWIIEDASHALGSLYRDRPVGCCQYSDMTVCSYHPVKHITTAEGGSVSTHDASLAARLRLLRSHGITSDTEELKQTDMAFTAAAQGPLRNPWYYEQQDVGYNYRITDLQCALGLSQLRRLDTFIQRRRQIADVYRRRLADLRAVGLPVEPAECRSNLHLFVLRIDFAALGTTRAEVMLALRRRRIITQVHYIPVHLQKVYRDRFGTGPGMCPRAEAYYQQCLSIPLYPAMSDADVEEVVQRLHEVLA